MYGELICKARKQKGMTQSELAYKLGISPVGIVQWEKNRRNPKLDTRRKIASALDIDITELMLEPEKEDYEREFGDPETRTSFAVYELEKLIDDNTKQAESCNGIVTTDHERKWALEHLEEVSSKYGVATDSVKKGLNQDLALDLEVSSIATTPKEKTCHKGRFVMEINSIMASMNEDGQDALLRHARELAQIPSYQKEH